MLHVTLTHDPLSAISGITTLDGRLFLQVRQDSDDRDAVVGFLRVLLRKRRGKILIIWEGSPSHQGQPIKDLLTRGAAKRLHLERLPGYAPDLNPDEDIRNSLKRVELKNRCCRDLPAEALAPLGITAPQREREDRAICRRTACGSARRRRPR